MNAPAAPIGPVRIPPDDPRISWSGRVLFEQGRALFDWPGTSLAFRFRGASVSLELTDGRNDYDLILDGTTRENWRTRGGEILRTFDGFPEGDHILRLSKRTEASWGVASFGGLHLPAGTSLLPPPPPPKRRIEFVGDSLVCGYGVEGNDPRCPACRSLENVHLSYAGLLAVALDAEARYIAWSGKGVLRNYGDPAPRGTETLPEVYPRMLAGRAAPLDEDPAWRPQLLVLQCGGNDFSTEPRPEWREWADAFAAFALRLLARHPGARLLCVNGDDVPRQGGERAVEEVRKGSGQPVPLVRWGKRNIREMGCDYHPNARAQSRMAEPVLRAARDLMGWAEET